MYIVLCTQNAQRWREFLSEKIPLKFIEMPDKRRPFRYKNQFERNTTVPFNRQHFNLNKSIGRVISRSCLALRPANICAGELNEPIKSALVSNDYSGILTIPTYANAFPPVVKYSLPTISLWWPKRRKNAHKYKSMQIKIAWTSTPLHVQAIFCQLRCNNVAFEFHTYFYTQFEIVVEKPNPVQLITSVRLDSSCKPAIPFQRSFLTHQLRTNSVTLSIPCDRKKSE